MGEKTDIQWCDSTVNGSSGCDGCELWNENIRTCYAGTLHETRLAKSFPDKYAADFREVRMIPGRFKQAANWSALRGKKRKDKPWLDGKPRCIFVGDMGDFLSRGVTDEFLKTEMLGAMTSKAGQRHFWMLLTKRPSRLAKLSEAWGGLPDNCMAMTTVTTQKTADCRIPELLKVRCRWHGLSCEPLLEPVDLRGKDAQGSALDRYESDPKIDLVILGGESGREARPCNSNWIKSVKDQCQAAGLPVFIKQLGANPTADLSAVIPEAGITHPEAEPADIAAWEHHRHNVPMSMKHPKGADPTEWPQDLRVRQFPEVAR